MKHRAINVDFYRVVPLNIALTLESVLNDIHSLPQQQKAKEVLDKCTYLTKLEQRDEFWQGEIIRIRMADFPVIADRDGNIKEIELEIDQGLGERTAFLFNSNIRVILLQTNAMGVSPSIFLRYLQLCCNSEKNYYAFDPILEEDSVRKLNSFTEIDEFEIHVAGLDNPSLFSKDDNGVDQFVDLYQFFRSPTISLKISKGQRKSSNISVQNIQNLAANWLRKTAETNQLVYNKNNKKTIPERATVIRITGSTPEENNVYVDLLKNRMREKIRIETRDRHLPYETRIEFLKRAYNKRRDTLLRMFNEAN